MRRINEVMDVEPKIRDQHVVAIENSVRGEIEFRSLNFAYGDGPNVLHDINLKIPAGTTIGIMGRVGAGKTTIARLIPRLIQTGSDQLFIDGIPIEKWPLNQLRGAIGYVSQNPFLFSNTLAANIAYGVEKASDQEIDKAAEWAQLRKDIIEFDNGYQTLIGERGVTLSGGQKQRSTLARALLRQPKILILDDSLSAVDTHTEEAVLGYLRELMRGRTTLVIAHRISTLRDCDHIIILDEGRIAEQGTHRELLDHGGFYADLHARQQLAAELETL
jgi:ATP-binding cassette, subfamily B, multidrug efflux pump